MRANPRESFFMLAILGLTGLVSILALLTLASNRIPGISSEQVTITLLAIQWHVTGLTFSKFGIDHALFTIMSKHLGTTFRLRDVLVFPVLPCAGAFFLVSLFLFSPIAAALISVAVILDTLSTFQVAVLNARRAFYTVSLGNLLNYPIFVLLLIGAAQLITIRIEVILSLFVLSSLLRYSWLALRFSRNQQSARPIALTGKRSFGAQGALNLALFRSDQITLAIALFSGNALLLNSRELSQYVFLARFPEFATGVMVLMGTVFFPTYHLTAPTTMRNEKNIGIIQLYLLAAFASFFAGIATIIIGRHLYSGPLPSLAWCVPFAIQIPLILVANLVTYSMQSQGYMPVLLKNLAISASAGTLVLVTAIATTSLFMLAWTVPFQLVVFIVLTYVQSWGVPVKLFKVTSE